MDASTDPEERTTPQWLPRVQPVLKQLLSTAERPDTDEPRPTHERHTSAEDELLLTHEERVIALLLEHDGRMRQQDIVAETEYADATVSQVLCEMEENGQITRYWKGNGKVVAVPELGPDVLTSSHP